MGGSIVGAGVGGLVVGALVVGALVVGALVVGALVVGALVVGALVVGALVVGARVVGALVVGARVVGGFVGTRVVVVALVGAGDGGSVGAGVTAKTGVGAGVVGADVVFVPGATVGIETGAIVGVETGAGLETGVGEETGVGLGGDVKFVAGIAVGFNMDDGRENGGRVGTAACAGAGVAACGAGVTGAVIGNGGRVGIPPSGVGIGAAVGSSIGAGVGAADKINIAGGNVVPGGNRVGISSPTRIAGDEVAATGIGAIVIAVDGDTVGTGFNANAMARSTSRHIVCRNAYCSASAVESGRAP